MILGSQARFYGSVSYAFSPASNGAPCKAKLDPIYLGIDVFPVFRRVPITLPTYKKVFLPNVQHAVAVKLFPLKNAFALYNRTFQIYRLREDGKDNSDNVRHEVDYRKRDEGRILRDKVLENSINIIVDLSIEVIIYLFIYSNCPGKARLQRYIATSTE